MKKWMAVTAGPVLVIAILLSVWLRRRISLERMETFVRTEVPIGSTSRQVVEFLDANRIGHDPVMTTSADAEFEGSVRVIYASLRDWRRGNLLSDGIFLKFHFDDQDRLVEYRIRYSWTSP